LNSTFKGKTLLVEKTVTVKHSEYHSCSLDTLVTPYQKLHSNQPSVKIHNPLEFIPRDFFAPMQYSFDVLGPMFSIFMSVNLQHKECIHLWIYPLIAKFDSQDNSVP
jgi:hypothetical protein